MKNLSHSVLLILTVLLFGNTSLLTAEQNKVFVLKNNYLGDIGFVSKSCIVKDSPDLSVDQIRFFSEDRNFKYSFSRKGMFLQLGNIYANNFKKDQNKVAADTDSSPNSTIAIFWDGMNNESSLYGTNKPGYLKNNVGKASKEVATGGCQYENIYYQEVYPGIDLKFDDSGKELQYRFEVQAGFDYKEIRLQIEGAQQMFIDHLGRLIIETWAGNIVEETPVVLQNQNILSAQWKIKGNQVSLVIPYYEINEELTIQAVFNFDEKENAKM